MKTKNKPILVLAILVSTLVLSACGKTNRSVTAPASSGSGGGGGSVTIPPSGGCTNCGTTTPDPAEPTPTAPPLSYEFTLNGTQAASTGTITTDNVLKVKFRVTAEQGNHIWKATELKVTIAVNGTEVTPTYTTNKYTYGMVGETSNVIDLSSYVTAGQNVSIQVKNPKNDFYCTYAPSPFYYWDAGTGMYQPVNPQYNAYPGCRKEVFSNHTWSGVLIVQTSSTSAI